MDPRDLSDEERGTALVPRAEPAFRAALELDTETLAQRVAEAEARLAGYDAVLVKPCQPDELLVEIRRARP